MVIGKLPGLILSGGVQGSKVRAPRLTTNT